MRLVSQIVVSMVLLSVAVVAAVSSGVTMTRTLSSYRPSGPLLMRIDNPSVDLTPDNLRITIKVMNIGDTQITVVSGVTYVLVKGTTGKSMIKLCFLTSSRSLPPGAVSTLITICDISTTELVDLFSSSWTGDMVKANTYYLYSKIFYTGAPGYVTILQ